MFAELTPAGIELIDEVFALHLANEETLLEGLDRTARDEIAGALALLERTIQDAVDKREAEATAQRPPRPRRRPR
jgi:DNA-binding MarR family transcriptional regulator